MTKLDEEQEKKRKRLRKALRQDLDAVLSVEDKLAALREIPDEEWEQAWQGNGNQ